MAFIFKTKPTSTISARSATSTDTFKIAGINSSLSSATETAIEINKLLAIGGKAIAADDHMEKVTTEQAEEED